MSSPLNKLPGAAAAATTATASKAAEKDPKLDKAGKEFEAIFVRQMLGSAAVAGKGGFAEMGVEALANAVTAGGGLGLGRAIADSLDHHHAKPHGVNAVTIPIDGEKK